MSATFRSARALLGSARPLSRAAAFRAPQRRFSTIPHATTKEAIESAVASNKVVVYSKTYCPYCANVKGLFKDLKVEHIVFELDNMSDGSQVQETLQSVTGRRTVPQVFIGGKFIGGCDDTMAALNSGKLKTIFQEAGVSAAL